MPRLLPLVLCLPFCSCGQLGQIIGRAIPAVVECLGAAAKAAEPLIPQASVALASPDYLAQLDQLHAQVGNDAVCAAQAAANPPPKPQAAAMVSAPRPDVQLLQKRLRSWLKHSKHEVRPSS